MTPKQQRQRLKLIEDGYRFRMLSAVLFTEHQDPVARSIRTYAESVMSEPMNSPHITLDDIRRFCDLLIERAKELNWKPRP